MARPIRDTFTVTRLPDGSWKAVMHGYKMFESHGATASEALANAGKVTDLSAAATDRIREQMADSAAKADK